MALREQVVEHLIVNNRLEVEGPTHLNQTDVRGSLTVGDGVTDERPTVRFYGDLVVDGRISGTVHDLIRQINASSGTIDARRIAPPPSAPPVVADPVNQALMMNQIALLVAVIALLLAIIAVFV